MTTEGLNYDQEWKAFKILFGKQSSIGMILQRLLLTLLKVYGR